MSIIALSYLLVYILIFGVMSIVGRLLFACISRPHATKQNAFLFAVGTLAGAYVLTLLAFVAAAVLKISLSPGAEAGLGKFSLPMGAFLGGTTVIWLRLRKKGVNQSKRAPDLVGRPQQKK
jgi:hypothetical protein